ncbi:MAG: hemolysin III family protein [Anaerocolumna sp.]
MYNKDLLQLINKDIMKEMSIFCGRENFPCAISHFLGMIVTGLITAELIVNNVFERADPWKIVAYSLFCACLCIYYLISVLVHTIYISERVHKALERIDACTLPLLVTGIYMPICFIILRGAVGWILFGMVWGYAVSSIILKALTHYPRWLLYFCQTLMCGFLFFSIIILTHTIHQNGLFGLTGGGLFYALGIMIHPYKILQIEDKRIGNHELSHYLTLLGSVCHCIFLIVFLN